MILLPIQACQLVEEPLNGVQFVKLRGLVMGMEPISSLDFKAPPNEASEERVENTPSVAGGISRVTETPTEVSKISYADVVKGVDNANQIGSSKR